MESILLMVTSVIASTESMKDLGIIVDSSLKFHNHTATVTANYMLAIINKSFEHLNTNMLLQLYKSFVMYHLGTAVRT